MGKNIHFMPETITQIVALHTVGHQTMEIKDVMGVSHTSVRWEREFKVKGSNDTLTYKCWPGCNKKSGKCTDTTVKRELEKILVSQHENKIRS